MGAASLVLGIFSMIFSVIGDATSFFGVGFYFLAIASFFGFLGLLFAIIGKATHKGGPSTGGLVTSILGLLGSAPGWIFIAGLFMQ